MCDFFLNSHYIISGPQVEEAREQVPEEPLEVLAFGGSGDFVLEADEAQRLQQVCLADMLHCQDNLQIN